ncbi:MAG: sensor histidine kinase [Candidatus Nitrosoglobus sp.]
MQYHPRSTRYLAFYLISFVKRRSNELIGKLVSLDFKRLFLDLALRWKIALVTVPLLIAILLLGYILIKDKGEEITFTQKETYGVRCSHALQGLMQAFMEHRGLASFHLSGAAPIKEQLQQELAQRQKQISERIQSAEKEGAQHYCTDLDTTEEWRNIETQWAQLQHQVINLPPEESNTQHNELITQVIDLIAQIKHSSNLSLDPRTDTYYLADTMETQLPNLINTIGILRAVAIKAVETSKIDEKDKVYFLSLQGLADLYKRRIERSIEVILEETPALRANFKQSAEKFSEASNHFFTLINKSLLAGANINNSNISTKDTYDTATEAVNTGFDFLDAISLSLVDVLEERIADFKTEKYIALGGMILFITFAIGVGSIVITAITRPIERAQILSTAIAGGNLENVIESNSHDETGQMLLSLSYMQRKLRQQAEKERLYLKELEDKNTELERFTYTVSHDLRSPLITIQGFSGALKQSVAQGNSERIEKDIQRIHAAADRMQLLLDDLLELSRIGRLVNPPENVSLEGITREATELVEGTLTARGVQIKISSNLPILFGDRKRLVEVMQNLIENAAKFMGDQKEPLIEIGALEKGGETFCYVQDNGIGIDPRYHEKIFDLFDKLDQNMPGTGVGLAIVKRIIEIHKGRIWVESEGRGQGSTFYFSIPGVSTQL